MKNCPNNHSNPDNAQFCRICGHRFEDAQSLPFHMAHPEFHLRPFSEFDKVLFWFNNPDYMEDPKNQKNLNIYILSRMVSSVFYIGISRNIGMEIQMISIG